MADATSLQPSAGIDLGKLLTTLAPIFIGSGKTSENATTTQTSGSRTTNSFDPFAHGILNSIASQSASNANDSSKTSGLVTDILHKAALSFAPTMAQSNSSGLYNSTTLSNLRSEAQANATAAASKGVLDYQTAQGGLAANAAGVIAGNTKTTDVQSQLLQKLLSAKQTAPAFNPITTLGGLGVAYGANKLLGSKTVQGLLPSTDSILKSLGITGNSTGATATAPSATTVDLSFPGITASDTPAAAAAATGAPLASGTEGSLISGFVDTTGAASGTAAIPEGITLGALADTGAAGAGAGAGLLGAADAAGEIGAVDAGVLGGGLSGG